MEERSKFAPTVALGGLLLGALANLLLRPWPSGLNLALCTVVLLGMGALLVRKGAVSVTGDTRWMGGVALLLGMLFPWRDSTALAALTFLALIAMLGLLAAFARSGNVRQANVGDYLRRIVVAGFLSLFGSLPLLFQEINWSGLPKGRWSKQAGALLRGLLIAIPLLFVFGGLLIAADAVFEKLVSDLFTFDLDVWMSHVVMTVILGALAAGYLRYALVAPHGPGAPTAWTFPALSQPAGAPADATVDPSADAAASSVPAPAHQPGQPALTAQNGERFTLGPIEIGVVLGLLGALFLAFVLVQFRYFFGGAAVVEASIGLTYAQYARRGFFELVWVSALVLPLLLVMHGLADEGRPAAIRLFRTLAGVLIALLFLIMGSALRRMFLYQQEFGLTELRLYATALMGWLAILFAWFAATELRGKLNRFAFGALLSGLTVLLALHLLNPDALIVRTNVARLEEGRDLDVHYVLNLSADAVPALIASLDQVEGEEGARIAQRLLRTWAYTEPDDWRNWKVSRSLARQAVEANRERLEALAATAPRER